LKGFFPDATLRAEFAHVIQDENRFATKGAHLNLKRAEKARAAIAKLPGIVTSFTSDSLKLELLMLFIILGARRFRCVLSEVDSNKLAVLTATAMVDSLIQRTKSWEEERGLPFMFDGV